MPCTRHELDCCPASTGTDHMPAGAHPYPIGLVFARQKTQDQPVAVVTLLPGQALDRLAKLRRRRGVDRHGSDLTVPERPLLGCEPNRPLRGRRPLDLLRPSGWPSGKYDNETDLEGQPIHSTWPSLDWVCLLVN